jgi:hypothetical protein
MSDPIEAAYAARMNKIALQLDREFNVDLDHRQVGFVLLIFPFNEGAGDDPNARTSYISNASRAEVAVLLREMAARLEGRMIDHDHGAVQ